MTEFGVVSTAEELDAVQRFRYEVYVEEMGRYRAIADHSNRKLVDDVDERSWNVFAIDEGRIVASTRVTWGGAGFSTRQIEQYQLAPFLAEIPAERLAVGERTMISPHWRGSDLLTPLTQPLEARSSAHDVRVVFGACEPHLLSYYGRWQRPYGVRNINSAEAGFLVPLVSFSEGVESLCEYGDHGALPPCISNVVAGSGTVTGPLFSSEARYEAELSDALAALPSTIFDGLDDAQIAACVARSNIVSCRKGDRLLKVGGAARNVFVVLNGNLAVSRHGAAVGVVLPGEVVGEMAFLSGGARQFDVDVVEDGTRVLSLSERTLQRLPEEHPVAAAHFFANLSRQLSARLAFAN